MRIFSLLMACLFSVSAYAQWPLPARQVTVSTNGWTRLAPTATTVQAVFNYLNSTQSSYLSGTNIVGAAFTNGQWVVSNQTAGLLQGTNIIGANYNSSNKTWVLNDYLPGTNIVGAVYEAEDNEWFIDFPGQVRESASFYKVPTTSSNVTIDIDNGQYQYLDITNNLYVSFSPPSLSKQNEIYVWYNNNSNFTVNIDSSFVLVDTNAIALTTQNTPLLFSYRTNPYSSKWYEQQIPLRLYNPFDTNAIPGIGSNVVATGGTITTNGIYKVHTFNTSGTFSVTAGGVVDLLVVGGGGGGGRDRGGGGGGGVVSEYFSVSVSSNNYTVTVGAGGAGGTISTTTGSTGSNSVVVISSVNYSAGGGSGGGNGGKNGVSGAVAGGSGSGKQTNPVGSIGGDGGQGWAGLGGGGGGMVGDGSNAVSSVSGGNGGSGLSTTFRSSTAEFFGGGGGGGVAQGRTTGSGGSGGGGSGSATAVGVSGTANTGGGGGGGGYNSDGTAFSGGSGGSGVVIIRYRL